MRKKTAIIVCLLLTACMLMVSAVVVAKKPPPKPPEGPQPTGTIFFRYDDGEGFAVWTMNADGSQKTKQVIESGVDFWNYKEIIYEEEVFGMPSRVKHGDHYWYLRFEGIYDDEGNPETYPDGMGRREIFAVKDDNSAKVKLTDDPTLASRLDAIWGIGDNSISWGAKRWVEGEELPTDFGIYSADLEWDEGGDLVGITGEISWIWDTGFYYYASWGYYYPNMGGHDWSPDETKIVYNEASLQDIYIVDLSISEENRLTGGTQPQWSPDGSKIAFIEYPSYHIKTINPDGTGEKVIVEPGSGKAWDEVFHDVSWSPDSKFLVYQCIKTTTKGGIRHQYDIYTIRVEDSVKKCVTNDLDPEAYKNPLAWR